MGIVSGLLLGLIGTGIAYFAQGQPAVPVETANRLEGSACKQEYQDAYGKKARGKKRNAALLGGVLGAATIGVVLASQSE